MQYVNHFISNYSRLLIMTNYNIYIYIIFGVLYKYIAGDKAKKRKCLVSGYPTNPNILGPTQTFLKTFRILKSNLRLF